MNTPSKTFTFTYNCGANPDLPRERVIATVRAWKSEYEGDADYCVEILGLMFEDTKEPIQRDDYEYIDNARGIRATASSIYESELEAQRRSEDPRHVLTLAMALSTAWRWVEHDVLHEAFHFIGGQRKLAHEALIDARALCEKYCEGFAGFDETQQKRHTVLMLQGRIEEVATQHDMRLTLADWSHDALMSVLNEYNW